MVYKPPHIEVVSIVNNRIINISEETRIPVIVGVGPSYRTVTDEAITRSSGSAPSTDRLSNHHIAVAKVAAYPGASGSYGPWSGNYVQGPGTSAEDLGYIQWMSGSSGNGQPRNGETYYVSYTYAVPSTQFDPQLFVDSNDVAAVYGNEGDANSDITTAAKIAFENGSIAVMCQQISGSIGASAVWTAALDKLKKKDMISYVVPLSSGSNASTARNATLTHCLNESTPAIGHERRAILGLGLISPDNVSVDGHIAAANAYGNKRVVLVVPGESVTRTLNDGSTKILDGTFAAAAVAGSLSAQERPNQPITGKTIVGIEILDDQYEPYSMNRMGNAGVCILYAKSGVIKCRHAITTDTSSANTEEISVVDADDLVRRITRTKLDETFLGKGIVIGPTTAQNVASAVKSIWNQLVRDNQIYAYGTTNDPTTGEVPISAEQDANEPRRINVTGSIKYLYPLNYINVSFYVYV